MSSRLYGVETVIDPQILQQPVLSFLKRYWDKKRGGRAMPTRQDINPAEMKEHLGWIALLDVLPGAVDFRFRTIGTRIAEFVLQDATGKTATEALARYGERTVELMLAGLTQCTRERLPVQAFGDASLLGLEFLDFDALYLPLSDDGSNVNMLLGAVVFAAPGPLKAGTGTA